ncbi:MAG TPA: hypothetical protein VLH79_01890 [Chthonomonadales bacterium]|nr:hypothetical protein [Chthonomonadales bacterium]
MTDLLLADNLASFQHIPSDLPPRLRPVVAEALRRRLFRLAVSRQQAEWGKVLAGWRDVRSSQTLPDSSRGPCCGSSPSGA